MEDFSTIPADLAGGPDSLLRSRRMLKWSVAQRREAQAAVADADKMGNPFAIEVMKSGAEHGTRLAGLSSETAYRTDDRVRWQEDLLFHARGEELKQSARLLKETDRHHSVTTDSSNAFLGTLHKSDRRVHSFNDLHRCENGDTTCVCFALSRFTLTSSIRRESRLLQEANAPLQSVGLDAQYAAAFGADARAVSADDPMVRASQSRQTEAEERINMFAAVDRFRCAPPSLPQDA
jgi:hypothetical protein